MPRTSALAKDHSKNRYNYNIIKDQTLQKVQADLLRHIQTQNSPTGSQTHNIVL